MMVVQTIIRCLEVVAVMVVAATSVVVGVEAFTTTTSAVLPSRSSSSTASATTIPSSTTITTTTASLGGSSSLSRTALFMSKQKKKPRFSQHVHISTNDSRNNKGRDGNYDDDDDDHNDHAKGRRSHFYPTDDENDSRNDFTGNRRSWSSSPRASSNYHRIGGKNKNVLNAGKSIEELEKIMAQRWEMNGAGPTSPTTRQQGTGTSSFTKQSTTNNRKGTTTTTGSKSSTPRFHADIELDFGSEGDEYIYDDDDDDDDSEGFVGFKRRPVVDPWEEEEIKDHQEQQRNKNRNNNEGGPKKQPRQQKTYVREFYDEDDEGYEQEETFQGGRQRRSSSSVLRVDHLIAPKPAGGSGGLNKSNSEEQRQDASSGSYFFNPDAAMRSDESTDKDNVHDDDQNMKTTGKRKSQQQTSEDDSENSRPSRAPPPVKSKPLLDDNGRPMLFTVDEAYRRFEDTVDEGTMEKIEAVDFPILATSTIKNDSMNNNNNNNNKDDFDDDDEEESEDFVQDLLGSPLPSSWSDLGVTSELLLENLEYMNCPTPLSVQEKTTPAILTGNDVLVGTYTGSGKTLSFLVPLVQKLLWNIENGYSGKKSGVAVLIVAPGRELASQIVSVARELIQDTGLTAQLAIGGTTFSRNLEQIRKKKPDILVGTPGRIAELVVGKPGEKGGRLKVSSLQSLVMDEFDALFEYKPHRDPSEAIMYALKRRHGDSLQSILCSATATDVMESTKVTEFLRPGFETAFADDEDVLVTSVKGGKRKGSTQVSRTVLHGVVHLPHRRLALETVRRILHTEPIPQQILIFVDNARKVDIVVDKLEERGIIAAPLHGGTPGTDSNTNKMERAEVSKALREGYVGIVVCTELAARGLDAPLLTHVINLDLPTDASHYAHRAGRCGRGGRPGVVINITTSPKERKVPQRFADWLGIDMHPIEPRAGQLVMLDPETVVE